MSQHHANRIIVNIYTAALLLSPTWQHAVAAGFLAMVYMWAMFRSE